MISINRYLLKQRGTNHTALLKVVHQALIKHHLLEEVNQAPKGKFIYLWGHIHNKTQNYNTIVITLAHCTSI